MSSRLTKLYFGLCLTIICGWANTLLADSTLTEIKYKLELIGIEDAQVESLFNEKSSLIKLEKRPIYSKYALNKRICDDLELLQIILHSRGYYDAQINDDVDVEGTVANIVVNIKQGDRYKFKSLSFNFGEKSSLICQECTDLLEGINLKAGDPIESSDIISLFQSIEQRLSYCGYPFANLIDHQTILIPDEKAVIIKVNYEPGKFIKIGEIYTSGNSTIPSEYIKNRMTWIPGESFDQRKLDKYRERLLSSRLFETIELTYPNESEVSEGGEVPISVVVKEGKPRTFSAGLRYSVNDGVGFNLGWTHRNLTQKADKFEAKLDVAQIKSKLGIEYELPDFWRANTHLVLTADGTYEDTEAYESRSYGGSALLRTEFEDNCEYYYGLSFERDDVKQNRKTKTGTTVGTPFGFKLDRSDDLLDPKNGYRVNLSVVPKFGKITGSNFMAKSLLHNSFYYTPAELFTLALWARAGTIFGLHKNDVLANNKFYSGGGGSVRGYGYQMAGPIDSKGDPLGGKSLLEGGVEARLRFTDDWGAVAFIEAGHVNERTEPNLTGTVLYGAGVGVRYFTSVGPIRADLAVPLKRRRDTRGNRVDDSFQFYISIGQGF